MTNEEAYKILNVNPHATPKEIKLSYYELMKKLHPDQGGNHYFAEKLNKARDHLLKKKY